VMVGVMGPIGSGLPQLGFPRRFAMNVTPRRVIETQVLEDVMMKT
jgi:hypothetical protein